MCGAVASCTVRCGKVRLKLIYNISFIDCGFFLVQIQWNPNQGKIAYGSVAPFNVMHGEVRSGKV